MSIKPTIVVLQGLSKQGSGVIKALLDGRYHVRTVTSRIESKGALALKEKGVEVVKADITKKEDLVELFKGAYGAFLMTPTIDYERVDYCELELSYIKDQGDAAVIAGLEHIVFSTVDAPTDPEILKQYKYLNLVSRFDAQKYLESLPIKYVSSVAPPYFHTNAAEFLTPYLEDDVLVFPMPIDPNVKQPYGNAYTIVGPTTVHMFNNPSEFNRQSIPVYSEFLSAQELVDTFQRVTSIKSRLLTLTREEFLPLLGPLQQTANSIFEIWDYTSKHTYYHPSRDINKVKEIDPNAATWEQFLIETNWRGEPLPELQAKLGL
eukprot:gene4024-4661_t